MWFLLARRSGVWRGSGDLLTSSLLDEDVFSVFFKAAPGYFAGEGGALRPLFQRHRMVASQLLTSVSVRRHHLVHDITAGFAIHKPGDMSTLQVRRDHGADQDSWPVKQAFVRWLGKKYGGLMQATVAHCGWRPGERWHKDYNTIWE